MIKNKINIGILDGSVESVFKNLFESVNIETIKIAFDDLYNDGILNIGKEFFGLFTTISNFRQQIKTGKRITKLGINYIEFIIKKKPCH